MWYVMVPVILRRPASIESYKVHIRVSVWPVGEGTDDARARSLARIDRFESIRRLSTTTTREGTHRDGTSAGDAEDGRIDRADVISSIGTTAREVIGRACTRGDALILDFDFDFDFDLISSGATDDGGWARRCGRRWIGR